MEIFTLDNGLKVLLKGEKGFPIVAGSFFFPFGSSFDEKEGITLLTLRTAFKGSLRRREEEFSALLERFGSPFGTEVSPDFSLLGFQLISDYAREYFDLLREVIEFPLFKEENFKVEKDSLKASVRSRKESPFLLACETVMRETYKGKPYSKAPYGTVDSLSSITLEESLNWYSSNFFPKGTVLSLCGDLKGLDDFLSWLNSQELKEVKPLEFESPFEDGEKVVERKGSSQVSLLLAVRAPSVKSPSFPAYKLLNTLLGEGIGSLLFQEMREKKGYAYSTGSVYSTYLNESRLMAYIETSPEKERAVKEELFNLFAELPTFITQERVKRAKEYLRGTYLLDHELRSKRAWYYGFWELVGKGTSYDKDFVDEVMAVSVSELTKVAEEVAKSPKFLVVVKDG